MREGFSDNVNAWSVSGNVFFILLLLVVEFAFY